MKRLPKAPASATLRARTPKSRPAAANDTEPPVTKGEIPEPPAQPAERLCLVFSAPDGPDIWHGAARDSLLDLLASAREGARRPGKRVLARAEIRRQAHAAFAGVSALLDEAADALRAAQPAMSKKR
jgi:hypothetical protein